MRPRVKPFDRRPPGVTREDYTWHHGSSLAQVRKIIRGQARKVRTRYTAGELRSLPGLYFGRDAYEVSKYALDTPGAGPRAVLHVREIPLDRQDLDEDEVWVRSGGRPGGCLECGGEGRGHHSWCSVEDDDGSAWLRTLSPGQRALVEAITDEVREPCRTDDLRLRRLRASGVVPEKTMRVLGRLPLVVEAVTVRPDGRRWWVDVYARWDDEARRGQGLAARIPAAFDAAAIQGLVTDMGALHSTSPTKWLRARGFADDPAEDAVAQVNHVQEPGAAARRRILSQRRRGRGARKKMEPLTILSTGLGRDSMTITALAEGGSCMVDGWPLGLEDFDAVVFSDPGAEWPLTYAAVATTQAVCLGRVPFYVLRKPSMPDVRHYKDVIYPRERRRVLAERRRTGKRAEVSRLKTSPWLHRKYRSIEEKAKKGGYHRRLPIIEEYMLLGRTTTRQSAECTVWHKIEPVRELLADLVMAKYGVTLEWWGSEVKAGRLEPHRMLLGIAFDEPGRARPWNPHKGSPWYVRDVYPLVEAEITKADESRILAERGWGWVHKSGCMGCFTGETETVTRQGIRPIGELAAEGFGELLIPTQGPRGGLRGRGSFRNVEVRSFGEQRVWEIRLRRLRATKVIRTTAEHRWVLESELQWKPPHHYERTTETLIPGDRLRNLRAPVYTKENVMPVAVAQGFVFGDGSRGDNSRPASAYFYGKKDEAMLPFFQGMGKVVKHRKRFWKGQAAVPARGLYGLPRFWKDTPPLDESRSFLLSWLSGYFAADGTVSAAGQVTLGSSSLEAIRFVRDVAAVCGIGYGIVREHTSRGHNEINQGQGQFWVLSLRLRDLPPWFFHTGTHAKRARDAKRRTPKGDYPWVVESVQATDDVEEVFCAVVPSEESFGLADGIMTRNCHHQGSAWFFMVRELYPTMFAALVAVEQRSRDVRGERGEVPEEGWVLGDDARDAKALAIKWTEGLEAGVEGWSRSPTVLKLAIRKGTLSEDFRRKLTKLDAGYAYKPHTTTWRRKARMAPRDIKGTLRDQMFEEFMAKGYDQTCAFGTVRP